MSMRSSRFFVAPFARRPPLIIALLVVSVSLCTPVHANSPPPLIGVARIGAGQDHVCAIDNDGAVQCWGANTSGQIGDGTLVDRLLPTDVAGLGGAVNAIAGGAAHTCAVLLSGAMKCWGRNDQGQLGDNSTTNRPTPVDVQGLGGAAIAVAAGDAHTCAVLDTGGVRCWGRNAEGQLGNGGGAGSLVPVTVTGLAGATTVISAKSGFTCVVVAGGLKCWGKNDAAQIGDNSTTNRPAPVDTIATGNGVSAVATGERHACALLTGGTMQCWGENNNGQHGDGTGTFHMTPSVAFGGGGGFTLVGAGYYHTCAANAGGIRCAGYGPFGALGDGSNSITQPNPVAVSGIGGGDASALSFGGHFSCALLTDSTVTCWGRNANGQLGIGSRTDFTTPLDVVVRDAARQVGRITSTGNSASVMPRSDASGRYVVFRSSANNLLGGGADTNASADIFRYDRFTGVTVRVSVNNDGSQLAGESMEAAVSADGNFVVFVAANAVVTKVLGESAQVTAKQRKQGGFGVFLRNLLAGTTQRVGDGTTNGTGTAPAISPQGNAVVFTKPNTDAGLGAMGQENVFVVPFQRTGDTLAAGTLQCVSCQSRSAMGAAVENADGASRNAVVSGDGRYVAYQTVAKNATAGTPAPCSSMNSAEIMLRDLLTGSTQRVSPSASIAPANCGLSGSTAPSIDWSGRVVVFSSDSALTAGAIGGTGHAFRTTPGDAAPLRLSETSGGVAANAASEQPVVSGDGQIAAFITTATNLDASYSDTNGWADIHVQRRGRTGDPLRLSKSTLGFQANEAADHPALNYNGTLVLFDSAANNLVPNDSNNAVDVFQRALPLTADVVFAAGYE